jgi:protein-S-isoprenylcysteine O-methyltransferase Ste14
MLIPILAVVLRVAWLSLEYPYLRRYRVKPLKDWDRHSAKFWDAANLIEPIGIILGFAGVGAMPVSVALNQGLSTVQFVVAACYRMRVEDRVLYETFGEEYLNYSVTTKRLIPKVY